MTPGVSRALSGIAQSSGPGAAKAARARRSRIFALAIRDGAVGVNPVRASTAKISTGEQTPRALTAAATGRLIGPVRASGPAIELGPPDLVDWTRHRLPD